MTLTAESPRLSRPEVSTLADILGLAAHHDRRLIEAHSQVGRTDIDEPLSDQVNLYEIWLVDFIATIAPAALARLEVLAPLDLASKGSILELQGEPLERFLGPIFEDAGIRHRLVTSERHKCERMIHASRRRYRFHFTLGSSRDPQERNVRPLSAAEQAEMLREHVEWEDIERDGRRIGRYRYTHVSEYLVQGEAIIEPREILPPFLQIEHVRTAGIDGTRVRFEKKQIEVEVAIDSVEALAEGLS